MSKRNLYVIFLLVISFVFAGTDGTIRGRTTSNTDGQPLPGVQIYIADEGIGTVSDIDGNYLLLNVPVGSHLLSWVYQKDNSQSSGEDCAWVDLIQFPPGAVSPLNIDFGDFNSDNIINILDV